MSEEQSKGSWLGWLIPTGLLAGIGFLLFRFLRHGARNADELLKEKEKDWSGPQRVDPQSAPKTTVQSGLNKENIEAFLSGQTLDGIEFPKTISGNELQQLIALQSGSEYTETNRLYEISDLASILQGSRTSMRVDNFIANDRIPRELLTAIYNRDVNPVRYAEMSRRAGAESLAQAFEYIASPNAQPSNAVGANDMRLAAAVLEAASTEFTTLELTDGLRMEGDAAMQIRALKTYVNKEIAVN